MVLLDGYRFEKSKNKTKKYDVYKNDKFITSFGSSIHEHYFDRIGLWSHKNHNDKERRRLYRLRHKNDNLNDKNSAGYFAYYYLW